MYCAFFGISRSSAFSTARTEAMACTVVQTPQMRWVKSQASRGSRPCRMTSMPRHIWPEDQESRTLPPSTSTSMRRWPSMRVMGSMTMRLLMPQTSEGRGRVPLRIGNRLTSQTKTAISMATSPTVIRISGTVGKYDQLRPGWKAIR